MRALPKALAELFKGAAAASLVLVLLWVHYAVQIFLFGVEFTRAYALKFGSHRGDPEQVDRMLPSQA